MALGTHGLQTGASLTKRGDSGPEDPSPYSPQPPPRCRAADKKGNGQVCQAMQDAGGAKMRSTRDA